MNIKRLKVEGLFRIFIHEIEFNENVTIIMGENGVGKTVTLNLIDAVFNKRFEYLMDVEYSKITITFLKETWTMMRSINKGERGFRTDLIITSSRKDSKPLEINSDMLLPTLPIYIEKVDDKTWYNNRNHMYYDREQIFDRYGMEASGKTILVPDWYQRQLDRNKVKLIKTQRLISTERDRRETPSIYTVKIYSNELMKQMQEEINNAGQSGADLDRSFPVRLLKYMKGHKTYNPSELFENLRDLEVYRHKLSGVGLLPESEVDNADDELTRELDKLDKNMLAVMHLYVKDSWEKLRKYDSIYNKVSILKDIINIRFNHKKLYIDSKRGFVFLPTNNPVEEIPVEKLSSGEQNELVLFYELLFKCDSKDLILIDEPEISLHLTWLQAMIGDLKRISKENGASLLIATHSPDFVGDNYDLVQNLG